MPKSFAVGISGGFFVTIALLTCGMAAGELPFGMVIAALFGIVLATYLITVLAVGWRRGTLAYLLFFLAMTAIVLLWVGLMFF